MPRKRSESGTFVNTIEPADVLGVFDAVDAPFIGTPDVVDVLGCSQNTARVHLRELAESDESVNVRTIAGVNVYWRTDPSTEGRAGPSSGPKPHPEANVSASAEDDTGPAPQPAHSGDEYEARMELLESSESPQPAGRGALPDEVERAIAEVDVPGAGEKERERREALRAVIAYLAREGHGTRSVFIAEVYPEHPAQYTRGDDPGYSWWKNCIGPALSAVRERTDALTVDGSAGNWQWVGEQ